MMMILIISRSDHHYVHIFFNTHLYFDKLPQTKILIVKLNCPCAFLEVIYMEEGEDEEEKEKEDEEEKEKEDEEKMRWKKNS